MDRIIKKTVYLGYSTIISSLGNNTNENIEAILKYSTKQDKRYTSNVCAINRENIDCKHLDKYTFAEQISIIALENVISKCNIPLSDKRNILILATTKGNIENIDSDFNSSYLWNMSKKIAEYFMAANNPIIVSNACVSGVAAIVIAKRLIEHGDYENAYVLGVDVINEFLVAGFNSFKSISPTVCKPYNKDRDGLTVGEGCGAILITNNENLSDNGITIAGGGISNDANHISGPSRTGDGLYLAIKQAIDNANITNKDIDYINTHGTGTPFNDEMESKALNLAELTDIPCNSLKPYIGHTFGASGVIETILLAEQIKRGIIFGVKGYTESGVPHKLNVDAHHRYNNISYALKTASGFGGTNAAIILTTNPDKHNNYINNNRDTSEISSISIKSENIVDFTEYKNLNDANIKFFKMDKLSKLGYIASCKLLKNIDLLKTEKHKIGIVIANRSSSLDTDIKHQNIVNKHLPEGASPAIFVYTLANIVAAEISIKHKLQGELSVFIQEEKDMNFLCKYSQRLINDNICDTVIYGWCELLNENYEADLKLLTSI